mmetsp:Transcript_14202/g.15651  ORF Transcript_14202/g.15651 Transcript_14202/m.15651 type:complete len:310 (+) Transcript_14202:50-979(+)
MKFSLFLVLFYGFCILTYCKKRAHFLSVKVTNSTSSEHHETFRFETENREMSDASAIVKEHHTKVRVGKGCGCDAMIQEDMVFEATSKDLEHIFRSQGLNDAYEFTDWHIKLNDEKTSSFSIQENDPLDYSHGPTIWVNLQEDDIKEKNLVKIHYEYKAKGLVRSTMSDDSDPKARNILKWTMMNPHSYDLKKASIELFLDVEDHLSTEDVHTIPIYPSHKKTKQDNGVLIEIDRHIPKGEIITLEAEFPIRIKNCDSKSMSIASLIIILVVGFVTITLGIIALSALVRPLLSEEMSAAARNRGGGEST